MLKGKKRDMLAVISGYFSFFAGWFCVFVSFFTDPIGEASDSSLYILGEALVFVGSIIGITQYTKSEIKRLRKDVGIEDEED